MEWTENKRSRNPMTVYRTQNHTFDTRISTILIATCEIHRQNFWRYFFDLILEFQLIYFHLWVNRKQPKFKLQIEFISILCFFRFIVKALTLQMVRIWKLVFKANSLKLWVRPLKSGRVSRFKLPFKILARRLFDPLSTQKLSHT